MKKNTFPIIDLCSHRRSWRFWADSVAHKEELSFPSVRAKSWSDFKKGRIDESQIVYMGIDFDGKLVTALTAL